MANRTVENAWWIATGKTKMELPVIQLTHKNTTFASFVGQKIVKLPVTLVHAGGFLFFAFIRPFCRILMDTLSEYSAHAFSQENRRFAIFIPQPIRRR